MKRTITAAEVRERFDYDPETGVFRYRVDCGGMKAGRVAGTIRKERRIDIHAQGRLYRAHRLAWLYMTGDWPKDEVDHIDGDPSNNAWANLRDVSSTINKQNRHAANRNKKDSPLLGAHRVSKSSARWKAMIRVDGRSVLLGCFSTAEAAHAAYIAAKREMHPGCTI